ncbi:MAG: tetratricopeptide repeat protein [Candidatus Puniceispirillaceae bacterium]
MRKFLAIIAVFSFVSMPVAYAQDAQNTQGITEEEAFAAVFADPGNILLNFQLASVQLKNGNLKEAAGTLERILILLPSNAEAQSLLAAVQLRLGNKPESERLSRLILANDSATSAQKQEATALIETIEAERNAYNFTGFVSIGGGVADNPAGGSRENKAEGGGTFSKRANAEEFQTANININLKRRLISQLPQDVNLSLNMSTRDYTTYNAGDLSTIGLTALYSDTFQSGLLRTSLGANRIHIDDRHYMNSYDGRVTYLRNLPAGLNGTIGASITRQVLKEAADGSGTDKTGNTKGLTAGIAKVIGQGRLSLDARTSTSRATLMKNAKKSNGVSLSYTTQIFRGVTSVTLDYATDKYRDFDTLYSSVKKRSDTISTIKASYLVGLETFGAPNGTEPYVQFAGKYSSAKSNIANFTKYSGEATVTVTKPF